MIAWLIVLLVALVASPASCAGQDHQGGHRQRFQDAEKWSRVFDDPARDAWQKPDEVIRALALPATAVVADIGSIQAAPDDPRLPGPVDAAMIVDTYHHIGNRVAYFERLRSRLAPGGRVVIIDFKPEALMGPPRHNRLAPDSVKGEMGRAGYRLVEEQGFLPHQYFLVFTPAR